METPPPRRGDELYRAFHDVIRLPIGGGAELVYTPFSREAHALAPAQARALLGCRGFATLDQHAARIAAGSRSSAGAVRAELAALAREGLLVTAGDLARRLREAPPAPPPGRIAAIGVPTHDRVESLREALAGTIEDAIRHGRALEYVVADSAGAPEGRARTRAALADLAARYGVPIAYAGAEEKARYAAALAAHTGLPEEVIAFGLGNPERCPFAAGGNRNAILLHTAGDPIVQIDDDTRSRIAPAPERLPGLALSSDDVPTELWFPAPGERAFPEQGERGFTCELHEELLGRAVGEHASGPRGGLEMSRATGMFFRRLEARGGRILCTQLGGAGDSGSGAMASYLMLTGRSRERLLASEAVYRRALTSRQIVRAAPRATIHDGSCCVAMSLGLDNRALLPPFMPVQRNGDGLFAVVLRRCFHDGFFGFLPWVVEHVPPEARENTFEALIASFGAVQSNDVLCLLVAASRVEADRDDPRVGLRALGAALERWGSLPLADFEEIARVQVLRARSLDLARQDEALRVYGRSPAYWARDVEGATAAIREALPRASLAYPEDLVRAFGEQRGREVFQRLVRRYGELLRVWPEVVEAAKELREKGVRLAATV